MKIVLIGNYPADRQPSMVRYADFLERELKKAGHDVSLISPRLVLRALMPARNQLGKWLGYIDKFLIFRFSSLLQIKNADVVHICDHGNSIYIPWIPKIPKVITCHDALAIRSTLGHYPQNATARSGRILQTWILKSLHRADHIVYVSEKTKFDFEQLLGLNVNANVIPHALNWPFSVVGKSEIDPTLRGFGLDRNGYLLHVGGNDWNKNRIGVLRMFHCLQIQGKFEKLQLVMAGKGFTGEMRAFCRENALHGVVELHGVCNEQLRALYSGAFALLFPSLEEGFGWPIVEAQACGCPVITSNRAPMNEIAGEGAKFVDPEKPDSIVDAMRECAAERDAVIAAGFSNLARFAVDDTIDRYEAVYELLSNLVFGQVNQSAA